MVLKRRQKYLQIALNSTPSEAERIISTLPSSDRILVEAGTPLIKEFGVEGIRRLKRAWESQLGGISSSLDYGQEGEYTPGRSILLDLVVAGIKSSQKYQTRNLPTESVTVPYIVADTKCADRGKTEVAIAQKGGASAATVLGGAPIETINYFIESCQDLGLDSMIDMIGVEYPVQVLRKLKKLPTVVILHRGVDEENFDKHKPIPYLQINKIRSSFNVMISIAGGDTIREVQRAAFNDADIVIVWKNFYSPSEDTGQLAEEFLKEIK